MRARFIRYYLRALTVHQVHSPTLFNFLQETLEDNRVFYKLIEMDNCRQKFNRNQPSSTLNRKETRLLFRIGLWKKPETIVATGNLFPMGIAALSAACAPRNIFILDNDVKFISSLEQLFDCLALPASSIQIQSDQQIDDLFTRQKPNPDLIYLNPRDREPNEAMDHDMNGLISACHSKSIIILSRPFENIPYWNKLKAHDRITASLNLFEIGVLFLDPDIREKIDLSVIRSIYKPWVAGFWPPGS